MSLCAALAREVGDTLIAHQLITAVMKKVSKNYIHSFETLICISYSIMNMDNVCGKGVLYIYMYYHLRFTKALVNHNL